MHKLGYAVLCLFNDLKLLKFVCPEICIWSVGLPNLVAPIKYRGTKGKIVSKLHISKTAEGQIRIHAAISRSTTGKTDAAEKVSAKDLRIDFFTWTLPKESLSKAETRSLSATEYQRGLSTLLGRDVANSLLQDVGFAHRLVGSMNAAQVDASVIQSVVDVSFAIRRLPVYLTAAVDENMALLDSILKSSTPVIEAIGAKGEISRAVRFVALTSTIILRNSIPYFSSRIS